MKVLITGGAGFIGSLLADRLLERGDEVLVIDNYSTGRRDNLRSQDGLTIVEGDIGDLDLVTKTFQEFQPQIVAHCAASYKDPDDWYEDIRTNATGTAYVVRASEAVGVKRLIYFQTCLCYGTNPGTTDPIPIDHPIHPDSSYAISKTAGEQYIELSSLDFVSFRLANMYGPRNISGPLPTFWKRLSEDKPCFVMDTRRDFIFGPDLIDLVMQAVDGDGERGHYHASSGTDQSIKELFDATLDAMGIELENDVEVRPCPPDDAPTLLVDPSKTVEHFGWTPKTPLAEGIKQAIAYYEEYGIEETFTHLRHEE